MELPSDALANLLAQIKIPFFPKASKKLCPLFWIKNCTSYLNTNKTVILNKPSANIIFSKKEFWH